MIICKYMVQYIHINLFKIGVIKMKLINIKNNLGYIENSCNIGYITDGKDVILIDSGLESAVAKKVVKLLDSEGYSVKYIINTHSHADHCGGNYYMQDKLGTLIYAPEFESAVIENPYLEPLYLSSGAAPLKELMSKFLMAKPSKVDCIIAKEDKKIHINSVVLDVVPLLGHSVNQIGIAVDSVLYCGDSILNETLLQKHKIPFNVNIEEQLKTLEFLRESNYETYIPSHCPPMNKKELIEAVDHNMRTLEDINNNIIRSLETHKTLEEIEHNIFEHYNIVITNFTQYSLLKTGIVAHVNYLFNQKYIVKIVEDNKICWKSTDSK